MCYRCLGIHNRKTECLLLLTVVALCFGLPAVGQIESDGSIVLARWKQGNLIVAADSREVLPSGAYRDDDCKILTFGDKLIFAGAGRAWITVKPLGIAYNSYTTARRTYPLVRHEETFKDLLMSFAHAWGSSVKKQLEPIKEIATTGLEGNNVSLALFTGYDEQGAVQLVAAAVSYARSKDGTITLSASADFVDTVKWSSHTMGHAEIIDEFGAHKTPRSQGEWNKLLIQAETGTPDKNAADVMTVLKLTIDYLPKTRIGLDGKPLSVVGGDIAAVEMTSDHGLRWIAPGHCQTQPEKQKPRITKKP